MGDFIKLYSYNRIWGVVNQKKIKNGLVAMAAADTHRPAPEPGVGLSSEGDRRTGGSTLLAALYVALFAFLLASSPARNSDLWLHLARGRDLALGQQGWAALSPFAASETKNPTWLYDLLTYEVFTLAGGAGLVFCK